MVYDLALGVLSMGMVVGGLYMIRSPELFITDANPTLQLLQRYLPEGWTRVVVRVMGAMLMLFFSSYFYVSYVW